MQTHLTESGDVPGPRERAMAPLRRWLPVLLTALAVFVRCADYGGQQGFLGLASLPAAAASIIETGPGPSPIESITRITSTGVTGTTNLVTIPAVDLSRSFVLCNQTAISSEPRNIVTCDLSAPDQVTLSTHIANSQVMNISVVQFASGAFVQRGSTAIGGGTATVDLPLSAVNPGRSFVILQSRMASSNTKRDHHRLLIPELVDATTLRLTRAADSAGLEVQAEWQVVQLDAATVQTGTTTLSAGIATASVTPAPFAQNSSFVLSYVTGSNAVRGRENSYYVRATPTTGSTIDFERSQTTGDLVLRYYLVSMSDGSSVQHGNLPIEVTYTNAPVKTAGLTAVDPARSISLVSVQIEEPGSATSSSDQDSGLWRSSLRDATTLELERASAEAPRPGALRWQVIEFQN